MNSIERGCAPIENGPSAGATGTVVGCAEGAGRHDSLNRRSWECSPSQGFHLGRGNR
jgi:hypothetical protein